MSAKLLAAQKAANPVEKAGKNVDQNYSYARAADVIAEARRALHEAGLIAMMSFTAAEERSIQSKSGTGGVYVQLASELRIVDPETAELVASVTGFGAGIDYPGDKAVYKAMTGAAKYAYASALGIPFGDDPEDSTTSAPEARAAGEERKGFVRKDDGKSPQEDFFRRLWNEHGAGRLDTGRVVAYLEAEHSGSRDGGISKAIDGLKDSDRRTEVVERLAAATEAWDAEKPSDVPVDDADLPTVEEASEASTAEQESLT